MGRSEGAVPKLPGGQDAEELVFLGSLLPAQPQSRAGDVAVGDPIPRARTLRQALEQKAPFELETRIFPRLGSPFGLNSGLTGYERLRYHSSGGWQGASARPTFLVCRKGVLCPP